jgi:hypothetical protein
VVRPALSQEIVESKVIEAVPRMKHPRRSDFYGAPAFIEHDGQRRAPAQHRPPYPAFLPGVSGFCSRRPPAVEQRVDLDAASSLSDRAVGRH